MLRASSILALISLSALACAEDSGPATLASASAASSAPSAFAGASASASASAVASAPASAPGVPKLTLAQIMAVKIPPPNPGPWAHAYDQLERLLGKPTHLEDGKYGWGAMDGASCGYTRLFKGKDPLGEYVSHFVYPTRAEKGSGYQYAECTTVAGVPPGPPEDPNALAPPVDGSPVPVSTFLANVIIGRSKWDKQKVTLVGKGMGSSMRSTPANPERYSVKVLLTGDDTKAGGLYCTLAKGVREPDPSATSGPIIATGTVQVSELVQPTGERILVAGLVDCDFDRVGAPSGE